MSSLIIWILSLSSIAAVLLRPFGLPEWVFAILGSTALVVFGFLPWGAAAKAVGEGADVYFFLVGMMLISEQAREEGLFAWIASLAASRSKGSSGRLFLLIYGAGILVTMFLSNDATAVVLTPAVYAAVKKAGAKPLPHLFACAFIANAASFLLPISNPANLVVFASQMPSLTSWVRSFFFPSVAAIALTYLGLRLWFRKDLRQPLRVQNAHPKKLTFLGKATAAGLILLVAVLLLASALHQDLGLPTFATALLIVIVSSCLKKQWPVDLVRGVTWGVIPLVAGLFVIVEAMSQAGAKDLVSDLLNWSQGFSASVGGILAGGLLGISTNLLNNLPVGLLAGKAVQNPQIAEHLRSAVLIGVDLGPNLSVTGSLATLLWLLALRREGEKASGLSFLAIGAFLMPLSLIASLLALGI